MYSPLGYKNAIRTVYEEKLEEARREAQQDPQYAVNGDVSIETLLILMGLPLDMLTKRGSLIPA